MTPAVVDPKLLGPRVPPAGVDWQQLVALVLVGLMVLSSVAYAFAIF
jgi:hypothetical protein